MRRCWCLTGQDGPPPPPLRGRPHRLTAGRGAAVPAPARTVSGSVSYCRDPVRGEKQQETVYNTFVFGGRSVVSEHIGYYTDRKGNDIVLEKLVMG